MDHQLQEAVSKVRATVQDGNTSGGPEKEHCQVFIGASIVSPVSIRGGHGASHGSTRGAGLKHVRVSSEAEFCRENSPSHEWRSDVKCRLEKS